MLEKIKNEKFVIFDTETTGLMPENGDEIIEIAAQKIQNNEVISEFYSLVRPGVPVTDGAYAVHGYSDQYLAENGAYPQQIIPQFCDFAADSILVGHNIMSFDLGFLNRQLQQLGLSPMNNLVIDTLIMARKLLPNLYNHKLSTVAQHFQIDCQGAHRAKADVEMNKQVFLKLLEIYLNQK